MGRIQPIRLCKLQGDQGRDPFDQNFRKFRSKTQWIGLVQPELFRKNWSTFCGGPFFPVGPILVELKWACVTAVINVGRAVLMDPTLLR